MFPYQQPDIIHHSVCMAASFAQWTGRSMVGHAHTAEELSDMLYHAPFVVVAHGTETDPVFCYANLAAQHLWNLSWNRFVALPSRLSAEPEAQEERRRLIAQAALHGYIDHYEGIRVTSDGRRFRIRNCILWNVLGDSGKKIGQAATFTEWEWL